MDIKEILAKVDHTLLSPDAKWEEIRTVLEDAIFYRCASACIPPAFVHKSADYVEGMVKICTVIGFPNGYTTTAMKCFEAEDAVRDGADEIDMVINIGWVKEERYDDILAEINRVRAACDDAVKKYDLTGQHIVLKVIIETCLLTDEEKIKMCEIVTASGADFIKTSTGFSTAGATRQDVALFAKYVGEGVQIKAAGGIASLADAEDFIQLGATRLGTSRIVKIAKNEESKSAY